MQGINEEKTRTSAVRFLELMYEFTPTATKKGWGVSVWSRFYTAIWKAHSLTPDMDKLVSEYFRLLGAVPQPIVEFMISHENDLKVIRRLLQQELRMLIGRIQFIKKSKEKN